MITWKSDNNTNKDVPLTPQAISNYRSAINMAKNELAKINSDLAQAKGIQAQLNANNHEVLLTKRAEIDNQKKQLDHIEDVIRDIKAKNVEKSDALDLQLVQFLKDKENFELEKAVFSNQVLIKDQELGAREAEVMRIANANEVTNKTLEAIVKLNENALNKILEEQARLEELIKESQTEKMIASDLFMKAKQIQDDAKTLSFNANQMKKQAEDKLVEAQNVMVDVRIKNKETNDALQLITEEKENLKDMIIQNKKAKLEAENVIEKSKFFIADSNQKIAQLNELKEAMAKKES